MTEQEIRRKNIRIAGVAALILGWIVVSFTNAQLGGGPVHAYPLPEQNLSIVVFIFIFYPLAIFGTRWAINPETFGKSEGGQND